jgi:hypothetical protein
MFYIGGTVHIEEGQAVKFRCHLGNILDGVIMKIDDDLVVINRNGTNCYVKRWDIIDEPASS